MPSDEMLAPALETLEGPVRDFQSSLAKTLEAVRGVVEAHPASPAEQRNGSELGAFAAGRIDLGRFAALLATEPVLDSAALDLTRKAFATLKELAALRQELLVVRVPAGGSLEDHASRALRRVGRAFGAARAVELSREGRYSEDRDQALLEDYPFERWTAAERGLVPPLLFLVQGADCRPEGLARFLDGRVKFVLVVEGPCSPVPLVRLMTPGVYVLQAADPVGLPEFSRYSGPGVAAIVPGSVARFVHDPAAGESIGARIRIDFLPEEAPREPAGGLSPSQQAEELAQLKALAEEAGAPAEDAAEGHPAPFGDDPADKLAAWLLAQADLPEAK